MIIRTIGLAVLLVALAGPAMAHSGHDESGFLHPFTGWIDHVLAMPSASASGPSLLANRKAALAALRAGLLPDHDGGWGSCRICGHKTASRGGGDRRVGFVLGALIVGGVRLPTALPWRSSGFCSLPWLCPRCEAPPAAPASTSGARGCDRRPGGRRIGLGWLHEAASATSGCAPWVAWSWPVEPCLDRQLNLSRARLGLARLSLLSIFGGEIPSRDQGERDEIGFNHADGPRRRRPAGQRCDQRVRAGGGYDQGRHPPFVVGHDGDQRDDPEGRRADDDRGAEQEGRPAGQEARGRGGRSGVELAAVRREGARAAAEGQGRRGVRLLDLGQPQVGAAGVRGAERHPLLPGPVRGPGEPA